MLKKLIMTLTAIIPLTACDMIESHPYDVNVTGEKHLTDRNTALIEAALEGKTSFTFAMISDTQRGYDETADAVRAINRRGDIDFVVHGGDFTEYGATREFEWARDILGRLKMPYVSVIGNHDCIATGIEAYETIFGDQDYAFTAGDVRFICLNTNALEFNYSVAIPDFGFLKNELAALPPSVTRTIVLMHAGPFSDQFNNNTAHECLKNFPGLQFCLYGHGHHVQATDMFDDGVIYYECANIKKRSFLVFDIKDDGSYDYEVVDF